MTFSPPRVLVVDDSDTIRSLIVLNLELEGFEVHQAKDGQECIELVGAIAPDVVTLDVAMPRLDGFATAERLKANPTTADIAIVLVTARAQGPDLAKGAEIGVDAYVTKPFDPDYLVAVVRRVLSSEDGQPSDASTSESLEASETAATSASLEDFQALGDFQEFGEPLLEKQDQSDGAAPPRSAVADARHD